MLMIMYLLFACKGERFTTVFCAAGRCLVRRLNAMRCGVPAACSLEIKKSLLDWRPA